MTIVSKPWSSNATSAGTAMIQSDLDDGVCRHAVDAHRAKAPISFAGLNSHIGRDFSRHNFLTEQQKQQHQVLTETRQVSKLAGELAELEGQQFLTVAEMESKMATLSSELERAKIAMKMALSTNPDADRLEAMAEQKVHVSFSRYPHHLECVFLPS